MQRRTYRASLVRQSNNVYGEDQPQQAYIVMDQPVEPQALICFKLICLIVSTYGLIVVMWVISSEIQLMHTNTFGVKSVISSYVDAGGLLFGLFCFYVFAFGAAWCWGFRQRERLMRQYVDKQIERQRAMQALMYQQ